MTVGIVLVVLVTTLVIADLVFPGDHKT
jgi:hypothetical protein